MNKTLKIKTTEEFHEIYSAWYERRPEHHSRAKSEEKRAVLLVKFPYTVLVEASWVEGDVPDRWCWQQFGPRNGPCQDHYSEYPACPLVLATRHEKLYTYTEADGTTGESADWEFTKPEEHSHEGVWDCIPLGKTGYDFGFLEWGFTTPERRDRFKDVVESLGFGEQYGKFGADDV